MEILDILALAKYKQQPPITESLPQGNKLPMVSPEALHQTIHFYKLSQGLQFIMIQCQHNIGTC